MWEGIKFFFKAVAAFFVWMVIAIGLKKDNEDFRKKNQK